MIDPKTTADVALAQSQLSCIAVMALAQVAFERGDPRSETLASAIQAGAAGVRATMVGPDIAKQATSWFDDASANSVKILRDRAKG